MIFPLHLIPVVASLDSVYLPTLLTLGLALPLGFANGMWEEVAVCRCWAEVVRGTAGFSEHSRNFHSPQCTVNYCLFVLVPKWGHYRWPELTTLTQTSPSQLSRDQLSCITLETYKHEKLINVVVSIWDVKTICYTTLSCRNQMQYWSFQFKSNVIGLLLNSLDFYIFYFMLITLVHNIQ